uniref:RING-type domain-containing protein n=1 Tax=Hyaloperonospora arabidopsidis (strain Emoy2) TaxID=559515 RepID=M4BL81_HYAAE
MACRSFEYRNSDWGDEVQLHDSTCAACELPVVIVQDDNHNLDVVLLPCGHAFHDDCLDDKSCPTCLEVNLETLNWC